MRIELQMINKNFKRLIIDIVIMICLITCGYIVKLNSMEIMLNALLSLIISITAARFFFQIEHTTKYNIEQQSEYQLIKKQAKNVISDYTNTMCEIYNIIITFIEKYKENSQDDIVQNLKNEVLMININKEEIKSDFYFYKTNTQNQQIINYLNDIIKKLYSELDEIKKVIINENNKDQLFEKLFFFKEQNIGIANCDSQNYEVDNVINYKSLLYALIQNVNNQSNDFYYHKMLMKYAADFYELKANILYPLNTKDRVNFYIIKIPTYKIIEKNDLLDNSSN